MVLTKKGLSDHSSDSDSGAEIVNANVTNSDTSSDFDSDDDSSSDDNVDAQNLSAVGGNESEHKSDDEQIEEEEEDEVIKAIRRENTRERDHPPMIKCDDHIVDISFHPHESMLGVASITGDVYLYKYTNDENTLVHTLELHTKACRDIEFSEDGKVLFSTSKDMSIMLSDVDTGKLQRFYEKAHNDPVYCLSVLDENLFATGDESGVVKLWDLREHKDTPVLQFKKNEDYISDIITDEAKKYLICSCGDGSLTTYDFQQRKFLMKSEECEDDEFTCLGRFRHDTKLLVGSTKGRLYLFNWHEFGLHSDIFPGPKDSVNSMIPITENIVVTACEDGILRATHLFPHRHLGVVGQHDLSVERVDICNNGQFIASCSDDEIKFWNIQYFEDFEKMSQKHNKHNKKREMEFNLPSSKRQNVADFFSDM